MGGPGAAAAASGELGTRVNRSEGHQARRVTRRLLF
jgi:hypothetical protein